MISTAGSVGGLSAAGITSGLAAIGGSMLGGIVAVALIPVAAGALGYGAIKGIKKSVNLTNFPGRNLTIVGKSKERMHRKADGLLT